MSKLKIEIQITLLSVVIVAAVVTSGFWGYKSLSQIVDSIHQASRPDNQLFLIKEIEADLSEIENNIRLYVLTNDTHNKEHYKVIYNSVSEKLQLLGSDNLYKEEGVSLIDSVLTLSYEKLEIWEGVLQLYESTKGVQTAFSEMYSKLEEQRVDTIKTERPKKGLLRKIFGTKKVEVDTTIVVRNLQKDEIKEELKSLESEIIQKGQQFNVLESQFIERNLAISENLNSIITQIEKNEADKLVAKTIEADRLAALTYKRLAAFSITAVILLLLVLYLLFNYLRKTRRYQQLLQKAKNEAETYAKAKEQFAANVSHELRTPVNAIFGLSEQLLQKEFPPSSREQMLILSKSAAHLKDIVNDTLDFSKIQADKLKFDAIHFLPSEVFKEITATERSEANAKGLELIYRTKGEIEDALIGDPLRLKQILLNLINNSLKFTDAGHILLEVETVRQSDEKCLLNMMVEDSGIGISKEDQAVIFNEFVQAENPTSKKYKGTGLGLSIVKKLVELQQGTISLESEEGKGTRIYVSIPYLLGNPDKVEVEASVIHEIPDWFGKLSVLVADDEEFNRFLLQGIFEKWGIKYSEAQNGKEAVAQALNNHFDLIFMDLNMPGKDGIEATKNILKERQEAKIIGITATNDATKLNSCIAAGMVAVLEKPFSEAALYKIIFSKLEEDADIQPEPLEKKFKAESSNIDFKELMHLANNDKTFFKEMLEIFIRSTEHGVEDIARNLESGDTEAIADAAHKMAAPCKHIKAKKLHTLLVELENKARASETKEIVALADIIKQEVSAANHYIRSYLESLDSEDDQI